MLDHIELAREEMALSSEAFEQGYYTMGRLHLNRAEWNLREYKYLYDFIGPRSEKTLVSF